MTFRSAAQTAAAAQTATAAAAAPLSAKNLLMVSWNETV